MYCYNCGVNIDKDGKFCHACGAPQTEPALQPLPVQPVPVLQPMQQAYYEPQPYPVPNANPASQPYPAPTPKKFPIALLISGISILVLIAIAVSVYFIFFRNISHMATIGRAYNNTFSEVEERFNNTPFKALTMLPEILKDGTVTTEVNYSYSPFFSDMSLIDLNSKIKLSSNTETREFALNIEENESGESSAIDVYLNRERLALRVSAVDDRFYGIRFDTFRTDIRAFGKLLFLSDDVMDSIADAVDILNEIINYDIADEVAGEDLFEDSKEYIDAVTKFMSNVNITSHRTQFEAGGRQAIGCNAIMMEIEISALSVLINDIAEILEKNDRLNTNFGLFDFPVSSVFGSDASSYGFFIDSLKEYSRSLSEYTGDITITHFIGRGNRLLGVDLLVNTQNGAKSNETRVSLDLGTSITGTWTLSVNVSSEESMSGLETLIIEEAFELKWIYLENSGRFENIVTLNIIDEEDFYRVSSTWDSASGEYAVLYQEIRDLQKVTGNFLHDELNFNLIIDLSDDSDTGIGGSDLIISIDTQTGSEINNIDFINIDKWGGELLALIMRLMMGAFS